jgi:predicted DNA-binding transcriptional regulator AlpA
MRFHQMAAKTAPLPFGELPDDALVRMRQFVPDQVPVSPATWWRMVKDGRAPAAVHPSPGVTAWRVGTLRQWSRAVL